MSHGEKTLKCDICGKAFRRRNVLFQHRTSHFPSRFSCDFEQCNKKFGTKQNLESHLRTHTGEKPYKCGICNSSFKRYHHLKKHVQSYTHLENIVEWKAGGKTIPKDLDPFNMLAAPKPSSATADPIPAQVDSCELCPSITSSGFKSEQHFQKHIRSRSHVTKVLEQSELGVRIPTHLIASDLIVEEEASSSAAAAAAAAAAATVGANVDGSQALVLDGGDIIYLAPVGLVMDHPETQTAAVPGVVVGPPPAPASTTAEDWGSTIGGVVDLSAQMVGAIAENSEDITNPDKFNL